MLHSMKTNHISSPLGFMLFKPVFSWEADFAEGSFVTDSRVCVYQSGELLFDSGFRSDIDRQGFEADVELEPRTQYSWTVSVRTDAGIEETSAPAFFETGKMNESWLARWIKADDGDRLPVFNKTIRPKKPLEKARLHVCGLGLFEARIDGKKVGDEYLTPYCTNYSAWKQAITFDITQMLSSESLLSITLADGWYAGRFGQTYKGYYGKDKKLLCEIWLYYSDGTSECLPSDESWTVTRSNILSSEIYDGEIADDTLLPSSPEKVTVLEDPTDDVKDRLSPKIRNQGEIKPVKLIITPKGEKVLDMGQNHAGIFRLRVNEPKGAKIHIQVGEVLQEGCFYRENLRTAKAEYVYTSGGFPATLEPRFTYYGYRYVKIEGIENLKPDDFVSVALHSDMDETGSVETGDAKVNRLIQNAHWGIKSNFMDVPTDCPQRDERMGWTGDAQVVSAAACRFRDTFAFYQKYLYDMYTEQLALEGQVPDVVPSFGKRSFSSVWGDACTVIPWNVYLSSGDKTILKRQYTGMKAWVDWIERLDGDNHGWRNVFHYGDWVALDFPMLKEDTCPGGTEEGFIADAAWAKSVKVVAKSAEILGCVEDAEKYSHLYDRIINGLKDEYFTPSGRCAIETQTALLLSLELGLSSDREKVLWQLDKRFTQMRGRLQTGFVGTAILGNTLSLNDRHGRAVDLLLNQEYPGWLYAVNLGATTIWERWNSMNPDGSVSSTGMNSFNHYAYGSIADWIFGALGGINPQSAGYKRAVIKPMPDMRLKYLDLRCRGYRVRWESKGLYRLKLEIEVPFDCEALLYLPFGDTIVPDGNPIFNKAQNGAWVLSRGKYEIEYETSSPLKPLYNIDDYSCDQLLSTLDGKRIIREIFPKAETVSSIMRKRPMRELIMQRGGNAEIAERMDKALKGEAQDATLA